MSSTHISLVRGKNQRQRRKFHFLKEKICIRSQCLIWKEASNSGKSGEEFLINFTQQEKYHLLEQLRSGAGVRIGLSGTGAKRNTDLQQIRSHFIKHSEKLKSYLEEYIRKKSSHLGLL